MNALKIMLNLKDDRSRRAFARFAEISLAFFSFCLSSLIIITIMQ